jgi:SAM-dependent methyltransferase
MDKLYAQSYRNLYERHWWWRSRECILIDVLNEFADHDSTQKILDFGCGDGLFFDTLSCYGEAYGIESDATLLDPDGIYRERIFGGDIFDAGFDPGSFGLILACDVLEHIDNDNAVMGELYYLLKTEGILIVTVPSFNCLWTTHDDKNLHKRRYVKQDMEMMVLEAGFTILKSRYFYSSLFFLKILQKALETASGIFCNSDEKKSLHADSIPPSVINYLLQRWYEAENRISYRLNPPFGSSLLMVARK